MSRLPPLSFFFFFNDTATTEIYTLSLHDALPISLIDDATLPFVLEADRVDRLAIVLPGPQLAIVDASCGPDRKSTRLNSSHQIISYAVFCLKKKKKRIIQ